MVLLAFVLTQAGCKTDPTTTLIATLGAVSSSSAVAIAVASSLESGGQIPEETARRIIAYAQAVSDACAKSVAALHTGDTTKAKVLNILSAVVEVEAPVVATHGNAKAKAVVAVLEAALAALKVQLRIAAKAARSSSATANPTSEQWSEIRRIARQAEDATRVAGHWARAHPALAPIWNNPGTAYAAAQLFE